MSVTNVPMMNALFDRWQRVWEQGQYDLIPSCIGASYIRHGEAGDRTVTREAYTAEIVRTREEHPNTRFIVFDHSFSGDRAWFRFTLTWTDPKSGQRQTREGMQSYVVKDGKLSETWLLLLPLGTAWSDTAAQTSWTAGE
jgi:hypothetical protein